MTYAQARNALRGPLRFGDDYQIRALRFLSAVAEVQERIDAAEECDECDGYGVIGEYCDCLDDCDFVEWDRCAQCHGTGHYLADVDLSSYSPEMLQEVIEEMYLRNYRSKRGQ